MKPNKNEDVIVQYKNETPRDLSFMFEKRGKYLFWDVTKEEPVAFHPSDIIITRKPDEELVKKLTIRDILSCTDNEKLSEWAAIICMKFMEVENKTFGLEYYNGDMSISKHGWKPHDLIEGKHQAMILAEMYNLNILLRGMKVMYWDWYKTEYKNIEFHSKQDWQVAVIRACIIAEIRKSMRGVTC